MERKPIIYFYPAPGVPVIDGSKLFYASWHLLNEAFTCYTNAEYFACVACLSSSIELWLRREMDAKRRMDFAKLIEKARKIGRITDKESKEIQMLRKIRNSFIHFDLDKLPKVKHMERLMKISRKDIPKLDQIDQHMHQTEVDPYPTPAHKDLVPLSTLAPAAYILLNSTLSFFMKRYPNEGQLIDAYYRTYILRLEGLDEHEIVFRLLPPKRRAKTKPRLSILSHFWKKLTR
jgi:hypothetical protein